MYSIIMVNNKNNMLDNGFSYNFIFFLFKKKNIKKFTWNSKSNNSFKLKIKKKFFKIKLSKISHKFIRISI